MLGYLTRWLYDSRWLRARSGNKNRVAFSTTIIVRMRKLSETAISPTGCLPQVASLSNLLSAYAHLRALQFLRMSESNPALHGGGHSGSTLDSVSPPPRSQREQSVKAYARLSSRCVWESNLPPGLGGTGVVVSDLREDGVCVGWDGMDHGLRFGLGTWKFIERLLGGILGNRGIYKYYIHRIYS